MLGTFLLSGAAADFIQQLAGALARIVCPKHVLIRTKPARGALAATKRVLLLRLTVLPELGALLPLSVLLFLCERLA